MRSVAEIQKDIEALQQELKAAQELEQHAARAEIHRIMERVGLTPEQLLGLLEKPAKSKKGPLPARYRHQGNEWSGMGRMPGWAKELGDQLEQFRVAG